MSIKINAPNWYKNPLQKPKSTYQSSTNKYKELRDLSWDIKKIKRETAYIKETGKKPPKTPDYYNTKNTKKLNIIS